MKLITNALAAVCLAVVTSGCATGRIADLRDCGRLSVGYGAGLGVHAEVGILTHPAIGGWGSRTRRIGVENRHVAGAWDESELRTPILNLMAHAFGHTESLAEGLNLSYERGQEVRGGDLNGCWINAAARGDSRTLFNRATDLEVGASALFVSPRAGVNPLEIADLVLGFVGLDIAGDDPKEP